MQLSDLYDLQQHYEDYHVHFADLDGDSLSDILLSSTTTASTSRAPTPTPAMPADSTATTPMIGGKPDVQGTQTARTPQHVGRHPVT